MAGCNCGKIVAMGALQSAEKLAEIFITVPSPFTNNHFSPSPALFHAVLANLVPPCYLK